MMGNLSERDRRTLRFGAIGVVGIVLVVFVGFPILDYWDGLDKKVAENQKKLASIESGLQDAASAMMSMRDLREKATIHSERTGLNQQTAQMLQQVETIPGYRGITVRRLEGLPLRDEEDYFRSGVSVQFTGTLRDLHQFLQGVGDAKPVLKVERLTITAAQRDATRVEGTMVISGYAVVTRKGKNG